MPQGRYSCAGMRPPALGNPASVRLRREVIPLDNRGIDWEGVRVFPEARLARMGEWNSSSERPGYNSADNPIQQAEWSLIGWVSMLPKVTVNY